MTRLSRLSSYLLEYNLIGAIRIHHYFLPAQILSKQWSFWCWFHKMMIRFQLIVSLCGVLRRSGNGARGKCGYVQEILSLAQHYHDLALLLCKIYDYGWLSLTITILKGRWRRLKIISVWKSLCLLLFSRQIWRWCQDWPWETISVLLLGFTWLLHWRFTLLKYLTTPSSSCRSLIVFALDPRYRMALWHNMRGTSRSSRMIIEGLRGDGGFLSCNSVDGYPVHFKFVITLIL